MVGANYTGGRRNAAKARSKDTAARLQRGHFSKQRLGIITDALRSRRPDHQSLSRALPSAVADNPNLTSNHPSGSLISPSRYSTCTQVATVYDISFAHAKRHLAQNQPQPRQSTQQDLHLHRNDDPSPPQPERPRLDPSVRNHSPVVTSAESSTSLALTGKGEPDPTSSPQTSLLATASTTISSCATSPSPSRSIPQLSYHPEPAFRRAALPDKQPTPVTEVPSKRRPKILDLIDISNPFIFAFRIPNLSPSLITALVIILVPQN
ncbi:hypothetical protein BDM02DRAFT_2810071 [Thelephora ganbajun]|uniref:Uncharacterized protein n=1 Tax=Thelephora ganbajun TaxID=370292 RepID=A0ACB6ZCP0_THEGA|nr:hypothetical protein BDM02DRAFT_2810071 [Thelephora ganbajun]